MINKHPEDQEIQLFVTEQSACSTATREHMQECRSCRLRAEEYRVLILGIKDQEKHVFDFDLAELVVAQLPPARVLRFGVNWWVILLVLLSVYPFVKAVTMSGNTIIGLAAGLTPVATGLFVITVAGLLLYLLMDMNREYRSKMKALDF